jgi:cyclic pyranopterin phosphate synthase
MSRSIRWSARFARITRRDQLPQVLDGIAAAREAGLAVKINVVALKGINQDEIPHHRLGARAGP